MYFIKLTKFITKPLIVFLKSLHKNERSFFPKKMFSSHNIYQKRSYQEKKKKKSCNAWANNQSIYIIKVKTERKSN